MRLEHLVGPALGLRLGEVVEASDHHHVLAAGLVVVDGCELAGQSQLGAGGGVRR